MFEDLSFEFKEDHLHLTHGDKFVVPLGDMEAYWAHLGEKCKRHACTSILIEGDCPTRNMDTVGAFTSGVAAASIAQNLWLALCSHGYQPDGIGELFRQAARNRGANVEFFNDREAALVWLRVNNPPF